MPMLNFVVFTLYPAPLSFKRDDVSLGLAHGACLLVRRDMYAATGGHNAIKGEINEDIRLAQNWRARPISRLASWPAATRPAAL